MVGIRAGVVGGSARGELEAVVAVGVHTVAHAVVLGPTRERLRIIQQGFFLGL